MKKFLAFFLLSISFFALPLYATVTNTTSSVSYIGNGSTAVYSYPYRIFLSTDLIVTTASSTATTTLGLGADYTVSGVLNYNGGNVTLAAGNLASGTTITINRIEPLTQQTSFRNQGSFVPAKHEDAYDKLTMMVQQQQNQINYINNQITPQPIYSPTTTNTPTFTITPTSTPTNTFTNTPSSTPTKTWTPQSYVPNAVGTFVGGLYTGSGPTYTPTVTPTTPPSTQSPNCVLVGKSLGAGSAEPATISSNVCTVTHTSHGYLQNDWVAVTGSPTSGGTFNLLYQITGVTTNTYTFATTGLANGPVTTNTELFWFSGTRSLNPQLIKNVSRASAGNYTFTFINSQADAFYGVYGTAVPINGFIPITGASLSASSFGINCQTGGGTPTDMTVYFGISLVGIQ